MWRSVKEQIRGKIGVLQGCRQSGVGALRVGRILGYLHLEVSLGEDFCLDGESPHLVMRF